MVNMKKNQNKNQKGFVALFTVLLVSVILAMAIGIASISLKEIVLSASASDGNKAFYAADSGIECALYFEAQNPAPETFMNNLNCNGNSNPPVTISDDPEIYEFEMPFGENNELCASLKVERGIIGEPYSVRIESRGSSVPCDDDSNPKKVERSIRVTY